MIKLCFILFSLCSASLLPTFEEYILLFNKSYSRDLFHTRKQVYEQNLQTIEQHNTNPISKWKMGVNAYTDLAWQEFWEPRELSSVRSEQAEAFEPLVYDFPRPLTIPTSKNWSAYVNPVSDQGKCGSCWAFAATTVMESTLAIRSRLLYKLSVQQFIDCSRRFLNYGCNGGWMHRAYQYARLNGICTQARYPYTAREGTCSLGNCTRIIKVQSMRPFFGESKLVEAVAQQPIAVAIGIDPSFQHYKSGVYDGPCSSSANHAVVVIGYTPKIWWIHNSWGNTWGEFGRMRMVRGKRLCGIGLYRSDLITLSE